MNTQASDQPVRSCIICEQEGDVIDLQRVYKKGIGTLISISSNLNKTELLQRLQNAEPAIEKLHVYVHKKTCRTELKNEASKIAKRRHYEENPGGEAKRHRQSLQRSGEQQFEWKCHCLICGNECADGHRGLVRMRKDLEGETRAYSGQVA